MDADGLPAGDGGGAVNLLFSHSHAVSEWVRQKIGEQGFGPCHAIGIVDGQELIAGVVYSHFSGNDMVMSIAATSPKWARRGVIRALFHYPFVQIGCDRVTSLIDESNERSIKLCAGLGFMPEGRLRKRYAPRDGIIYGLLKEDCRWLKEKAHGQEFESASCS